MTAPGVDDRALRSLRGWDLALTLLHLGQAVAVVVLAMSRRTSAPRRVGPWRSYACGENAYLVLSLVATSALARQIFGGSLSGPGTQALRRKCRESRRAPRQRPRSGVRTTMHLLTHVADGYDPDHDVNLSGYADSLAVYSASVAGLLLVGRATGQQLPEHYSVQDLALGGIATHKLTRLLSKASVTSPLRAPFTRFERAAGSGEHVESPRHGHGVRHTIGELLTCPFCLGVWIGTAYVAGVAVAPRPTRALTAVLTVVALSDTMQHAYARLRGD